MNHHQFINLKLDQLELTPLMMATSHRTVEELYIALLECLFCTNVWDEYNIFARNLLKKENLKMPESVVVFISDIYKNEKQIVENLMIFRNQITMRFSQ